MAIVWETNKLGRLVVDEEVIESVGRGRVVLDQAAIKDESLRGNNGEPLMGIAWLTKTIALKIGLGQKEVTNVDMYNLILALMDTRPALVGWGRDGYVLHPLDEEVGGKE
jgi:hypothetical protein